MKILLAEDEKELSNAVCAILKHSGYETDAVYNGIDAYEKGSSIYYDGIILDLMMPGMNGIDVLKKFRENGIKTPVLILTAKSDISDKITGLDAGADDYLTKPFSMGELLARLRAVTRRAAEQTQRLLSCGDITLDREEYELTVNNSSFRLSGREFQVMEMLMLNFGIYIPDSSFKERIWNKQDADRDIVFVYMSYLKKKLNALGSELTILVQNNSEYALGGRCND